MCRAVLPGHKNGTATRPHLSSTPTPTPLQHPATGGYVSVVNLLPMLTRLEIPLVGGPYCGLAVALPEGASVYRVRDPFGQWHGYRVSPDDDGVVLRYTGIMAGAAPRSPLTLPHEVG